MVIISGKEGRERRYSHTLGLGENDTPPHPPGLRVCKVPIIAFPDLCQLQPAPREGQGESHTRVGKLRDPLWPFTPWGTVVI